MEDSIVSLVVAKLAEEKMFNIMPRASYDVANGNILKQDVPMLQRGNPCYLAAPTHSLLQKWLREVHEIEMYVIYEGFKMSGIKVGVYTYCIVNLKTFDTHDYQGDDGFQTYEEAFEFGLETALKLI